LSETIASALSPSLMRELDSLIEAKVRAAVSLAVAPPTHFTSSAHGAQPPGKSRRWARDHFPSITGARKVGRDWIVSVADFDRWAARHTPRHEPRAVAGPWSPAAALEAAGVRPSAHP